MNDIYTKLGEECAQHGCAVDLFVFPNTYLDLTTIGEVCRVSGGEIYKFNHFSVSISIADGTNTRGIVWFALDRKRRCLSRRRTRSEERRVGKEC